MVDLKVDLSDVKPWEARLQDLIGSQIISNVKMGYDHDVMVKYSVAARAHIDAQEATIAEHVKTIAAHEETIKKLQDGMNELLAQHPGNPGSDDTTSE